MAPRPRPARRGGERRAAPNRTAWPTSRDRKRRTARRDSEGRRTGEGELAVLVEELPQLGVGGLVEFDAVPPALDGAEPLRLIGRLEQSLAGGERHDLILRPVDDGRGPPAAADLRQVVEAVRHECV